MVVQLGMNRKVLWRYVTFSNNLPDNIAASYLNAVREHGGCPLNYIPTWAQKMELWLVLFFLIAVSKIETAVSKLKLP